MLYCPIQFATPAYDEAVKLRYEVLKEPLGLDFTVEALSEEFNQFHLAAYAGDGGLTAYLLLTPLENKVIQMRQVVVKPAFQRKSIGKGLVMYSEAWSRHHGYSEMVLHARKEAVAFYEKLGYSRTGKSFEEVGIPHWLMKKKLSA
ncbi:MAG: GNAT family N-acetyltransferase [Saprospiraceae bacterium]|nr:GNAT family N-acetyltransferase [Saprospiraceae bacterium]